MDRSWQKDVGVTPKTGRRSKSKIKLDNDRCIEYELNTLLRDTQELTTVFHNQMNLIKSHGWNSQSKIV